MHVIKKISDAGSNRNEDFILYRDNHFALLLDGATGLKKDIIKKETAENQSDAAWFVQRFSFYIEKFSNIGTGAKELVTRCIGEVKKDYEAAVEEADKDPLNEPSASMALIKRTGEKVEIFILGDITVLMEKDNAVEYLWDDSVSRQDTVAIAEMVKTAGDKNTDVLDTLKEDKIQAILKENRKRKNREQGYWILGMDEEAVGHGIYMVTEEDRFDKILFCSDGFAAYYDKYHLCPDIDTFMRTVEMQDFEVIVKKMRETEYADEACNRYPRFKRSDDASAILLSSI